MSITWWTRLEPRARKADMKRALQVSVRDPLWMLARQRQVGELTGEDAGSPVVAQIQYMTRTLTGYQPIGGPAVPFDDAVPIEAHVEREGANRYSLRGHGHGSAPHQRAHPRQEFTKMEGLGDVVVGTAI